jgi:AcrR family transcriptional regulator
MGFNFGSKKSQKVPEVDAVEGSWSSRLIGGLSAREPDSPTKRYHHGDLRQALLDATLTLIEEHGPQGFTLRAAARKARVTPGATYHHFKDKEDMVAAVAQEGFDLLWKLMHAAAQKPVASARERARNVGVAYVLFAVEHPTRFRVMLGYGVTTRTASASTAIEAMNTYRFVRQLLVSDLTQDSAERVSEAEVLGWWSVVHGLAFLAIDGYLGKVTRSARLTEEVVRNVIDALDRRPPPGSGVRRRDAL